MYFEHERIRAEEDRDATAELLTDLGRADLTVDERDEIVATLAAIDDPAAHAPLVAILEDHARPAAVRGGAGRALRAGYFTASPEQLRRWWTSGDREEQRHALLTSGGVLASEIESLARDAAHPLHRDAIDALRFDHPGCQDVAIRALRHADTAVRITAAATLSWDEPLAAEGPLLEALADRDRRVVHEVLAALPGYRSQRVWRALTALRDHHDGETRYLADTGAASIGAAFVAASSHPSPAVRAHVRRWLAPIWDELDPCDDDRDDTPPGFLLTPTVDELRAALEEEPRFAVVRKLLQTMDWAACPAAERRSLTAQLVGHREPHVREAATLALHHWGEQDALLQLADDGCFLVRKAAAFYLGATPPHDARVAAFAWQRFIDPRCQGEHAADLLNAYARCAEPAEAVPRLVDIAGDRDRAEPVRAVAIGRLAAVAGDELGPLLSLLDEPPPVTWHLAIALLDGAAKLGLPVPRASALAEVDHVDLQVAIAPFVV